MKNNYLPLFFSLLFVSVGHAQNSLEITANPFVYKFGNLNNQYTSVSSPYVATNYKKHIAYEIGINYHRATETKWGWGLGLGWKQEKVSSEIDVIGISQTPPEFPLSYESTIGSINLRPYASYQFSDLFRIEFALNFYSPLAVNSNFIENVGFGANSGSTLVVNPNGGTTVEPNLEYDYFVRSKYNRWATRGIVPEFKLSAEIAKNLSLTAGIRFKFWNSYENLYTIEFTGYMGEENYGTSDNSTVFHHSSIKSTDFSYTLGLTYRLPFKRK